MLSQLHNLRLEYPRQFWLLFFGLLISTIGTSMIWPFLMVYTSERLALPLTAVASLLTVNAAMGLIFSFIAGPIIDRAGRKWVMVISLAANLAPADMRGRYMSLYGLTWGVAAGIGPVLGGLLNDNIGPRAIWVGGMIIGLVSTACFLILARRFSRLETGTVSETAPGLQR